MVLVDLIVLRPCWLNLSFIMFMSTCVRLDLSVCLCVLLLRWP